MINRLLLVWALLLIASCAAPTGPVQIAPPDPSEPLLDFDNLDYALLHRELFNATNRARRAEGLKQLNHNPLLEQAAAQHAGRMVKLDFFEHDDPFDAKLRTPKDRVAITGVRNPLPAENLAEQVGLVYRSGESVYPTPEGTPGQFSRTPGGPLIPPHSYRSLAETAVARWLNSPSHRANILSTDALELGCGAAFHWRKGFPRFKLVQVFQLYEPAQGP